MRFSRSDKPREVTGRTVLLWLVGFFAVVFLINGIMAKAAISTFGGVQTQSSYKAGQTFKDEVAMAKAQDGLRWKVDGKLDFDRAGAAVLDISVRDAEGQPVGGLTADAQLRHPADSRRDRVIAMRKAGPGAFHGEVQAQAGGWELIVDFYRGDRRMYRSRSAVVLK